ncbi:hypothetical protein RAS1_03220 [Phycisphaerae bacterium RAS1]|nr:hypothetical protein RAS1_03220 [Phycisphaerae bacterium RAS1]
MRQLRKFRPVVAAVALAFHLVMAAVAARAEFQYGHVYVTHAGTGDPFTPIDTIYEIDPASGQVSPFLQYTNNRGLGGMAFTPDGSGLRVFRRSLNQILEVRGDASQSVVLSGSDGLAGPAGNNGLAYDRNGDFFVFNDGFDDILRFPGGHGPPDQFVPAPGYGSIAFGASGDLYWGGHDDGPQYDGLVLRIRPDGTTTYFDSFGTRNVQSLTGDSVGNLYVMTDENTGTIYKYPAENPALRQTLRTGFGSFFGTLAVSPDLQTLYVGTSGGTLWGVDTTSGARRVVAAGDGFETFNAIAVYVPEPSSLLLAFTGGALLSRVRRSSRRQVTLTSGDPSCSHHAEDLSARYFWE